MNIFGFGKKKEQLEPQEPNMGNDRFSTMEKELQEGNPERQKEANGARYIPSPIVEEKEIKEPRMPVYPTGNKPQVFSSGRQFSKQLGAFQSQGQIQEEENERVDRMPVVPKARTHEFNRPKVREEDVKQAINQLHEDKNEGTGAVYQNSRIRQEISEAPLPQNSQRTANGYLVSIVMNEQQFQEFLKGNKSVLKVFPVLAENPEKAAQLMEKKNMIPIEVFEYNFFKSQVERIEQLARENNITLLRN